MKKPRILILLFLLLLALLAPTLYQSGTGKSIISRPEPQTSEVSPISGDSGEKTDLSSHNLAGRASDARQSDAGPSASNSSGNSGPSAGAVAEDPASSSPPGIKAAVAVVGKNGKILFGPAAVTIPGGKPATALTALAATGLPYAMSSRFPDLVVSIADQQNQGQSGWMYKVNGVTASVAAPKKHVSEGDRIIWWYSQSLDAPSPEWETLLNNSNNGGRQDAGSPGL